ncbi:ATP-binding protein [Streptomyces yaizuensis]|uniref:ATP-binding protein n=1 Tax=Streptomyces yaizuensis TaxID=2989713 RepID=A0AA86IVF8_9ACTN|nr:ATP-binding protein [Streptomyces sp. YSPA8]BDT39554.1 ATP-binding protein [Streptomyces sp. YSPA8]
MSLSTVSPCPSRLPGPERGFECACPRTTPPGSPLSADDARRPGQIRRIVRASLRRWGLEEEELVGAADIAITELVTNALAHGQGPDFVVRVRVGSWLVIEVIGDGPVTLDGRQPPGGLLAESGRGLDIVRAVAADVRLTAGGRGVRCELTLPKPEGAL